MGESWFEQFDHVADVGIRAGAPSLASLYETAGRALMAWIGPPPRRAAELRIAAEVAGDGVEELLVRWLQELLFLFHARHGYFLRAEDMRCSDRCLSAEIILAVWDEADYGSYQEVKAVTYHQLSVTQKDRGWEASFILDI